MARGAEPNGPEESIKFVGGKMSVFIWALIYTSHIQDWCFYRQD